MVSFISKYLCRIGLHPWVRTGLVCRHELRCRIRNEVRGEYCGNLIAFDWITDRRCPRCGVEDNQIAIETAAIRQDEQATWDQIRQDRDEAKEFTAMMDAVSNVSKSLAVLVEKPREFAQYERPSCVTGRSWCFGTPSEPGDYEWASMVHSLNPDEVTVYRNYNGHRQTWGRDVWFRKISGASNAE